MTIDPEIFEKVRATLCDALSVDEDEVTEEALNIIHRELGI